MWQWLCKLFKPHVNVHEKSPADESIVDEEDILVTLTAIKFLVDNGFVQVQFPEEYTIWITGKKCAVNYHPPKKSIHKVLAYLFRNEDIKSLDEQAKLIDQWIDGSLDRASVHFGQSQHNRCKDL